MEVPFHARYGRVVKQTAVVSQFAAQAAEEQLKDLFIEFARAEKGHVNGLRFLIKDFEDGTHDVQFFCPVCGWPVSFGASPAAGAESLCRMCGVRFALKEEGGNFLLERR